VNGLQWAREKWDSSLSGNGAQRLMSLNNKVIISILTLLLILLMVSIWLLVVTMVKLRFGPPKTVFALSLLASTLQKLLQFNLHQKKETPSSQQVLMVL
jgi:hypothetical protein